MCTEKFIFQEPSVAEEEALESTKKVMPAIVRRSAYRSLFCLTLTEFLTAAGGPSLGLLGDPAGSLDDPLDAEMLEHSPKDPNMSSVGKSNTVEDSYPSDRELELEQIHLAVPRSLTFAAAVHQVCNHFTPKK